MSAILTSEQLANAPAHDVIASHIMLQELVDTLRGQLGTERNMQRTLRDELSVHAETNHTLRRDLSTEQSAHDRLKKQHGILEGAVAYYKNQQLQEWEADRRRCWIERCARMGSDTADRAIQRFEQCFPRPAGGAV